MMDNLEKLGLDELDVDDVDAVESFVRCWQESLSDADGIRVQSDRLAMRNKGIPAGLLDAVIKEAGSKEDAYDAHYQSFGGGIVDIVLGASGEPAWLVADKNDVRVEAEYKELRPWRVESLPWQPIPTASMVRKHLSEGASAPFDDLVTLLSTRVVLPEPKVAWARLLAAWQCGTYLLDHFRYFPLILLEGPPERGKTRLGKALLWPSYRGFYTPSPTAAILFRDRARHRVSLLLDVEDLPTALLRGDLNDLTLNSFERDGIVRRCTRPDAPPEQQIETFSTYGPTILISNERVKDKSPLVSRCIRLSLPEAGSARIPDSLTPAEAADLRARLLAWAARVEDEGRRLPQVDVPFNGRLADLARPILQTMQMVAPVYLASTIELFRSLDNRRRSDIRSSLEARVARGLWAARDRVENSRLFYGDLVEVINNEVDATSQISERVIGVARKNLGLQSARGGAAGRTYIEWPGEEVARALYDRYSLPGRECPSVSSAPSAAEHPGHAEHVPSPGTGRGRPVMSEAIAPVHSNGNGAGVQCIECGSQAFALPICPDCTLPEMSHV